MSADSSHALDNPGALDLTADRASSDRRRLHVQRTTALGTLLVATVLMSANYRLAVSSPVDLTGSRLALVLLIVAWLAGVLDVRPSWPVEARRFNQPLAWFTIVATLTLLIGVSTAARDGMVATGLKRLVAFSGVMLAYVAVVALLRTRRELKTVTRILVGAGTVAAISGISERLASTNPLRTAIEHSIFEKYQFTEVMIRASGSRVYGTAGHPIEFGAMMSLLLPLALYLAFNASARRARWGWSASAVLIATAMMFAVSRSSLIAAAVGLLALAAHSRIRPAVTILTAAALGLAAINVAYPALLSTLLRMLDPAWIVEQESNAFSGRMQDWPVVWDMVKAHPLVGIGYDLFDVNRYFYLDNQYLKFVLELGVLGLGAMLWLFAQVLRTLGDLAHRSRVAESVPLEAALLASCASFICLGLFFDTFGFFQLTNLFFVFVGMAVVASTSEGRPVIGGDAA